MASLVSMVIPCYNKEKYISAMLNSVLEQTHENIQVIMVNDGSVDGTQSIIYNFEHKLKARGYQVKIINQNNQGQGLAIYNGLIEATGIYVCFPDCDDILDREYVSAMVEVLDKHADTMQVVCAADRCHQDESCEFPDYFERLLLMDSDTSVCLRMIRVEYLKKIYFFEKYLRLRAKTQEPQLLIPLAKNRGKVTFIPKVLYKYIVDDNRSYKRDFLENKAFWEEFHKLVKYSVDLTEREVWMNEFGTKAQVYIASIMFFSQPVEQVEILKEEMLYLAKKLLPNIKIKKEDIDRSGIYIFWRHITNCILGTNISDRISNAFKNKPKRIIGYGALGQFAPIIISALHGTPFEATELWDISAQKDSVIMGTIVLTPEFNGLCSEDIIFTLPRSFTVKKYLEELDTPATILNFREVCDLLVDYYYPIESNDFGLL